MRIGRVLLWHVPLGILPAAFTRTSGVSRIFVLDTEYEHFYQDQAVFAMDFGCTESQKNWWPWFMLKLANQECSYVRWKYPTYAELIVVRSMVRQIISGMCLRISTGSEAYCPPYSSDLDRNRLRIRIWTIVWETKGICQPHKRKKSEAFNGLGTAM